MKRMLPLVQTRVDHSFVFAMLSWCMDLYLALIFCKAL